MFLKIFVTTCIFNIILKANIAICLRSLNSDNNQFNEFEVNSTYNEKALNNMNG